MRYVGSPVAAPTPSGLTAFQLISTANGGSHANSTNPRAFYDSVSDKTFFAYIGSDAHVYVCEYNHSTNTTTRTSVATTQADPHACPAVIMRASDRKLVVVYGKHNVAYLRRRISTNAADSTAWGTELDLTSTLSANNITYPNLVQLSSDASGTLRLWFRNYNGTNFSWRETISTDGGATFPAATQRFSQATAQAYLQIAHDGVDTIHFVYSNTIPVVGNTVKLAHCYRVGTSSYYQSDGTTITPGAGGIGYSAMTEFWDGSGGAPFVFDLAIDGSGYPMVAHVDGPNSSDWRYTVSRWDGSAWGDVQVVSGYDSIPLSGVAGGFCISPINPDRLIVSAMQPSGRYEMETWESTDSGATFDDRTAITTGSSVNQMYPFGVHGADAELEVIWLSGQYNNSGLTDFDFALIGAGT